MPAMRFFTADLHLGHANIIKHCHRPFASVDDMDEALLVAWCETVGRSDEVWVLGDFALGDVLGRLLLAELLPGRKFLVPGNHDKCWAGKKKGIEKWRKKYEAVGFKVVNAPVEVDLAGRPVLLDHFPYEGDSRETGRYLSHRPADQGGWLLHGHVHERWRQRGRQVNVGVDAWGGRPVAEGELAALIQSGLADLGPLPWHAVPDSA